jgi:type II secretory pathway pseudopilin PulG
MRAMRRCELNVIKLQKGATLLEVTLVLAIAASILVLGIRMYLGFKRETDFAQVQYNVDTLFQAMSLYYRANCGLVTVSGSPSAALAPPPLGTTSTTSPTVIDLTTDLINSDASKSYLDASLLRNNSFLINSNANYILQFNPSTATTGSTPVNVNACTSSTACTTVSANTIPNTSGFILKPQVAIRLPASTSLNTAKAYQLRLGADCVSRTPSGPNSYVDPCSSNPSTNPPRYLVWERLPSFASPYSSSIYWQSTPLLRQFNLQYTHDQMYELMNTNPTSTNPTYYLCGG